MTKPTPRKMRGKHSHIIHDEHECCEMLGCVPVEPEPSRSVQRRVAVQKGESMPTFEPEPPTGHRWAGSGDYGGDAGGTQKMCVNCGVDMQDDEALAPCPNPVAPETLELCADCHHPKNDHTMHHDAPGTNWGAALHWFRAPQEPGITRIPMDWGDALRNLLKLAPIGDATRYFRNGIQFILDTPPSASRAIPEAEPTIYVASRASLPERPAMWRRFRDAGAPIISSWIDESGDGETASFSELWERIEAEIRSASLLILYVEAEDLPLKGALIEVGMALAMGKPVAIVAPGITLEPRTFKPIGSWTKHPRVTFYASVEAILRTLEKKA